MAVKGGPNIVTQGLNLVLDSGNKKSIPLDPTINLKTFSQDYTSSGANYNFDNIAATPYLLAPDGTLTATLLTENTASAVHRLTVTDASLLGLQQNKYYTLSFHIKNNGRPIGDSFFEFPSGRLGVTYNLSNGTVANYGSNAVYTCSITPVDNGYYRISYTGRETASLAGGFGLTIFRTYNESGSGNYTGNGLSGSYFWGFQVEPTTYATPYTASIGNTLGRRTNWNNIAQINTTASLSSGSVSSSMPQFQSLGSGILNFDGTGSYSQTNTIITGNTYTFETVFSASTLNPSVEKWLGSQYPGNNRVIFDIYIDNYLRNFVGSGTNPSNAAILSTTIIQPSKWYHAVFTKDALGTGSIYVNGVLEATGALGLTTPPAVPFQIGGTTTLTTRWFSGKIPIAKLYNRALTADEVRQNYNALKTRFGL